MGGDLIAAFGAGMLSFLSPCVLPLVPGYLSLMSGVSTANLAVATKTDVRLILRSTLLFVAGFTLVFTALGATAHWLGQLLNDHRRVLDQVSGVLVIVMGLFLAGIVAPQVMMREKRMTVSPSRLGAWAPPVMGMAFAFGWTPCIGPVLATVLNAAQRSETLGRGVLLLLVYSLGLGVPFVASGLAFDRLAGAFDWFKRNARVINFVAGALLVVFGFLLLTGNVTWLSARFSEAMDWLGLDRLLFI